eukprot:310015-Amphidinium_carterae.1
MNSGGSCRRSKTGCEPWVGLFCSSRVRSVVTSRTPSRPASCIKYHHVFMHERRQACRKGKSHSTLVIPSNTKFMFIAVVRFVTLVVSHSHVRSKDQTITNATPNVTHVRGSCCSLEHALRVCDCFYDALGKSASLDRAQDKLAGVPFKFRALCET